MSKTQGRVKEYVCAIRGYEAQLEPILDHDHKLICVFGGNRSGKTQAAAEWMWEHILANGGPDYRAWWVAYTRDTTRIAVEKLVEGEPGSVVPPLIPRELIKYYPPTIHSSIQEIHLIDGTRIPLKHAGRRGANLKGRKANIIVGDEFTEVDHEMNFTILINRLMDTGGQMIISTTPKAGHWLEPMAKDIPHYKNVADLKTDRIQIELSCFSNPWQTKKSIEATIGALGGDHEDPRVQREVYGKWVPEGDRLWRHWKNDRHTYVGHKYAPESYGWINITPLMGRLFRGQDCDAPEVMAGWDVNDYPQSVVFAHVVCKDDEDQHDPQNWRILFTDEVVTDATVHQLADKLALTRWKDCGIISDANACYPNTRVNRLGQSADATVLRKAGFAVSPPRYENQKPKNPSVKDRCNLMHQLMAEGRFLVHKMRCPELLRSLNAQTCDERGLPFKKTATLSDKLSGPTDAAGYLCYAVFAQRPRAQIRT